MHARICKPGAVIKHSLEFGGVDAEKVVGDQWKIAADGGRFISNRAWVSLMRESVRPSTATPTLSSDTFDGALVHVAHDLSNVTATVRALQTNQTRAR